MSELSKMLENITDLIFFLWIPANETSCCQSIRKTPRYQFLKTFNNNFFKLLIIWNFLFDYLIFF